jgi:hypothetical protein
MSCRYRVERQLGTNVPQAPGTGGPSRHTARLTTLGPGGAPHVRPLGVIQHDGFWYFNSSADTQKTRNLARDRRCVLSLATTPFDLVLEGVATQISDTEELTAVAEAYAEQGWPARVEGDALTAEFSAPSGASPRITCIASSRRGCTRSAPRSRSAPAGSTCERRHRAPIGVL